jgi:hypothetical protein
MRIVGRPSEHFIDPFDQPFGHDVLQLFGLVVDFGPAHAHHLHEKELDETVTPEHKARQLFEIPEGYEPVTVVAIGYAGNASVDHGTFFSPVVGFIRAIATLWA